MCEKPNLDDLVRWKEKISSTAKHIHKDQNPSFVFVSCSENYDIDDEFWNYGVTYKMYDDNFFGVDSKFYVLFSPDEIIEENKDSIMNKLCELEKLFIYEIKHNKILKEIEEIDKEFD